MYTYHYHATIQEPYGAVIHIDGVLQTLNPIQDIGSYRKAKETICAFDGGLLDARKLIIRSLSLLEKGHATST